VSPCRTPLLRAEDGAAAVAAVALSVLIAVGVGVVGQAGRTAVLAQRTAAGADLVALAAAEAIGAFAEDPCVRAAGIAAANEVDVASCTIRYTGEGPEALVTVRSRGRAWPLGVRVSSARAGLRPLGIGEDADRLP